MQWSHNTQICDFCGFLTVEINHKAAKRILGAAQIQKQRPEIYSDAAISTWPSRYLPPRIPPPPKTPPWKPPPGCAANWFFTQ
jgi:hypothetical protein